MAEKNTLQQEITNIKQEYENSSEKLDLERSEWQAKLRQEQLMKTQAINKLTEILSKRNDASDNVSSNRGVKDRNNRKKDKELQLLHKEYYTLQAEFDKARFDHDRKMDELKQQMELERQQFAEEKRKLEMNSNSENGFNRTPPSKKSNEQLNGDNYYNEQPRTPQSGNNPHFVVTGATPIIKADNLNSNSTSATNSPSLNALASKNNNNKIRKNASINPREKSHQVLGQTTNNSQVLVNRRYCRRISLPRLVRKISSGKLHELMK